MIDFSLFGVHVKIRPTIWVSLAVMAYLLTGEEQGMAGMSLFVVAAFLCIFAHEMGHALVGRWLGGGRPVVELEWLGGICSNNISKLNRLGAILTTAAGPLTSLALVLPVLGVLLLAGCPFSLAYQQMMDMVVNTRPQTLLDMYPPMMVLFIAQVLQVSVWWSVLNLLPIFPLDGGIIMNNLMHRPRLMHIVSMFVAGGLALMAFAVGLYAMVVILLFLIFYNYKGQQESPY